MGENSNKLMGLIQAPKKGVSFVYIPDIGKCLFCLMIFKLITIYKWINNCIVLYCIDIKIGHTFVMLFYKMNMKCVIKFHIF